MSKIFPILLAFLAFLSLSSCAQKPKSVGNPISDYEQIVQSGKIRCAYAVYNPGCIKDPNTGKLSGIGVEAIEKVAGNLGLKVQFTEEVGWGTMIEGLNTRRYDLIATPVWETKDRAKAADFTEPLYYSPVFAYVKASDNRFDFTEILNSPEYRLASIDGATAEIIAQESFPSIKRVSLPQTADFSQLLLTVSTGKADVTFTEPQDAELFLKKNPGSIKQVGETLRVFPNCWLIRKDQNDLKKALEIGINQLKESGEMDKIISRYESTPGILLRTSDSQNQRQ